jgi:hypothetical protein
MSSGAEGPRSDGAPSGAGARPVLIAVLGLVLLIVGAAIYLYGDEAIELAQSLLGGRAIHAQGHIRY